MMYSSVDGAQLRAGWNAVSIRLILGAYAQVKAKATTALADPFRQIGEYIRRQPVAHADETRNLRGNECRWL